MPDYLSLSERRLLGRFAELMEERAPGRIRAIRVFGSRARGDSDEDSDLDVAIEPAGGETVAGLRRMAPDAAWDAMEEMDLREVMLPPVILPMDGRGLAGVVEEEGLLVWPPGRPG